MATATEALPQKPTHSLRGLIFRIILATLMLVGGYYVVRLTSLRGLPEIPPPFDPATDGVVDIRPEENAFTFYIRAHEQYRDTQPKTMTATFTNWSEVDADQLKFIDDNRESLATWLEGTKLKRALYHQPGKLTFMTMLPAVQSMRNFCRAGNLVAFRYEHEGDYARAWEWYRANLRASRHCGQDGVAIERLVGIACYAATAPNVRRWSENPKVSVPLLKQALNDVIELDELTGPARNIIRAEYFSMINSLEDREIRTQLLDDSFLSGALAPPTLWQKVKVSALSAYGAIRREPDRSRRVIRLVVTNWLTGADASAKERLQRLTKFRDVPFYTPAPGSTPVMSNEDLGDWVYTTLFARMYLPGWGNIDKSLGRDEQTRAALIIHIAEQLYLREKGKAPESPHDLVGSYLKEFPAGYDPTNEIKPTKPAGSN